ncbi:MAG: hypothetical protein ACRDSL_24790 [Pseudonocardiaceae bacterium]
MTAPYSTSPDDTTRKIDLNLTQVAAAALAAVTAAVLGSRLGAAGTLIGAGGASVITTVGTAVYRASLERSRERVRSLASRTRPLPTFHEGSRTERSQTAGANAPLGDERLTDSTDRGPQPSGRSRRFTALRWGTLVAGGVGGFVLAMMLITGFEWASGETLGGNQGTTIGQAVDNPPGPPNPVAPPAPPSSDRPTSEAPTETTTTIPDGGRSVAPSPSTTSGTPTPSEVRPTPPLLPTELPGIGD